jgi:GT2 family glycosyltransferase/predicted Zn-dependent protease
MVRHSIRHTQQTTPGVAVPPRHLFGPVSGEFSSLYLTAARRRGDCLAFGPEAGAEVDLAVGPADSWDAVLARLPSDWRPEFVALWLPYAAVPAGLWASPVPLVGLAADYNLLWHQYVHHQLPCCDLVLTDAPGVEALGRAGISHARAANLYGLGKPFLDEPAEWPTRDIDVLFVGNLSPAVQRQRLPWLARLSRLAERWKVCIAQGVHGEEYRALLRRSRVVFNRSARGECNQRAFEAAAGGALLFQEVENREVGQFFRAGEECVCYSDSDLERLLEHALLHEEERAAIAARGRERALREGGYDALWTKALETVQSEWPLCRERAERRLKSGPMPGLASRVWARLSGAPSAQDPALEADLRADADSFPFDAGRHRALGLTAHGPAEALARYRRAFACDPLDSLAGLGLAEALLAAGQATPAADAARSALAALERSQASAASGLDGPPHPGGFEALRVEWEAAVWRHAGDAAAEAGAKRSLLRSRLHSLLADLTGDLSHFHEAVLARPDLPTARAALGCALARAGRLAEALPHLRLAVEAQPFDAPAARALYQVLSDIGDRAGARQLARRRRLLHRSAPGSVPAEPWFEGAPPAGEELASVVVLCCNELDATRACLESVLRHTRAPYELVPVDNGSTDGTPEYLAEVQRRPGPVRVAVIRNAENRGFPRGANQGIAASRGAYVVLVNNDCAVTPGWLDGLVGWAVAEGQPVGLVGPVSNYAPAPQHVPAGYRDLSGLDAFATAHRAQHAGKALQVERLTGFCLLVRRDVLAKVGALDEGYGPGFFEDDDLCVRAREAGFRLLLAQDVYVHHEGSRTFKSQHIDTAAALRENFERFRGKWGEARAAGYHLPAAAAAAPAVPAVPAAPAAPSANGQAANGQHRPRVSLTMIVRNEEGNLPDCLRGLDQLFDEIVVVDTGSTDGTKAVAESLGAKVFDFPWVDDFAAARNAALDRATGEWAFWLDADDRLDAENREKLKALFAALPDGNAAYVLKCRCVPHGPGGSAMVVDHVRLFRRDPAVRWEHRVHEQVLMPVRRAGHPVHFTDVRIDHVGYADPALRGRKLERDLRLLRLELAERPDDPFTLFNAGSVSNELGKPADAIPALRRSLELSHPSDSIVRKLYAMIAQCHRRLGQAPEALAACKEGRRHYPEDAELLFVEALARQETGDPDGAEGCLRRLIGGGEGEHFASVDAGLRGFKARYHLGALLSARGRGAEAEAQWRSALAEEPGYWPARLGLAELYLGAGDWGALGREVAELGAAMPVEAAVLTARSHLARKEFAAARWGLAEVIEAHPRELMPRVILTHVLLQEGQDWAAAERALRDVLALDPAHPEARKNLAVLHRQHGVPVGGPPAG